MATPTPNGALLGGPVRPNDDQDLIATAFANEVKGGNHGYATIAERDAIIEERREWGMLCCVYDNQLDLTENGTYVLTYNAPTSGSTDIFDNGNWVKTSIPSGSGNGGTAASGGGVPIGAVMSILSITAPDGWLRLRGETIGDVGSGATYPDAKYEALFKFLFNSTSRVNIPESSGAGSADAAWDAGGRITLPNTDAKGVRGSASGYELGATDGANTVILTDDNLPDHGHTWSDNTPLATSAAQGGTGTPANTQAQIIAGTNNSYLVPGPYPSTAINGKAGTTDTPVNIKDAALKVSMIIKY